MALHYREVGDGRVVVLRQDPGHGVEAATAKPGPAATGADPHGAEAFDPFAPSKGLTFWGGITFLLLLFLLAKFAWRPILSTVEAREKRIRADLDGAEKARVEADQTLAQYKRQLDEAALRARETIEEARVRAEKAATEINAQARVEAEALLTRAKQQIEAEKDKALADVKQAAVEIALEITRTVVKRTASQEDLAKTADELMPRFKTVA
jgi:F-type H+-transporting ATPase subunit b